MRTTETSMPLAQAALKDRERVSSLVLDISGRGEDGAYISLSTLVIWMGCLAVGVIGLVLPYPRPQPPAKAPEPIQAEILNVQLTSDPLPQPETAPPTPAMQQPPPLENLPPMQQPPPLAAVAEPSPAISFPMPVQGPTRIVEAKQAIYTKPVVTEPAPVVAPAPQVLTFGQGEGKQPAPSYPVRAEREGQEGTVGVRFSVGENGQVLAAEAVSPSPWPLLNNEAVRTIRMRWRFKPGPMRLYEVSIRFKLNQ